MNTEPATVQPLPKSIHRWVLMWNALSYLVLLVATISSVSFSSLSLPLRAACLVFSAAWAAWYWIFVVRMRDWLGRRHIQGMSFIIAVLAASGMAWVHSSYLWVLFGLYGVSFGVLPFRWAVPTVILVSLGGALRVSGFEAGFSGETLTTFLWFSLWTVMAILLGWFMYTIIQQSHERDRVIEQLRTARDELAQAERQAGVLEERQRLAAAIHDTLAQGLTGIIMHLEAAEQVQPQDPQAARQHLERARLLARENLAEARQFVWSLQPELAVREPLPKALERLVKQSEAEKGLQAAFSVEGQYQPLPSAYEVTLLRAAQEGLANISKHARARTVNLTLTYMEDEVFLDLQDDGLGFNSTRSLLPNEDGSGFGLFSLQERARQLGGELQVESAPGEGTTLTLRLPLAAEEHARANGE